MRTRGIGTIACAVLAAALTAASGAQAREPGIPRSERLFDRIDKDKNGKIALEEITPQSERRFMVLDADNDGAVAAAEIEVWLKGLMDRRRDRIMERMDFDGDGKVSKAEFARHMQVLFEAADGDHDGGVTLDEARAYHDAKRRASRQEARSKPAAN